MEKGKIIQVSGPVIDVLFEKGNLPHIKDALTVDNHGKKCVMEVAKHMGHNIVRCIMLSASEGLCRDMEVTQTGAGITVPVGEKTLGRLFNVLERLLTVGERLQIQKNGVSIRIRLHLKIRVRSLKFWRQVSKLSTF